MRVPEWLSQRLPALEVLEDEWEPVSRGALLAWLVFYALLLGNKILGGTWLSWFDLVFVPVHEGGHLMFRLFGEWVMIAGGTFLQLFVPFALAAYFAFRRQLPGTTFCAFFLFEQLLPVGIYMADARSQSLPLVTVGDPELAEHDWFYLFSHAGLLNHDVQIGVAVRILGWLGMLATVGWFAWRGSRPRPR